MRDSVHPARDADDRPARADSVFAPACAETALVRSGLELLGPVRALLARHRSALVTICQARGDPKGKVRLFAWTDTLEPGEEILAERGPTRSLHAEIVTAGERALRQVALRWPPYALPPVIGLVSDGSGLAVSGEHPCGLSRRWLIDQLGRGAPASVIIPFDQNGVWALLSRTPAAQVSSLRN